MEREHVVDRLIDVVSRSTEERARALAKGLEECRRCEDTCGGINQCERFQTATAVGGGAHALWRDTVIEALSAFFLDCGRFPTSVEGIAALIANPGVAGWRGPYWHASTASILDRFDYRVDREGEPLVLVRGAGTGGS